MKVHDVSHRTGQGVGHTLVEVTEKHKDMAEGRGRRSKKNEEMWKERKKGAATGEDVAKSYRGGFGKKWRGMAPREGK